MNQSRAIIIAGALIALAVVAHGVFPRYEVHHVASLLFVRIDRWSGTAETAVLNRPSAWLTRGNQPNDAIDPSGLISPGAK